MVDEVKFPSDSKVIMTEIVHPQHTNALGGVFGGVIMSWIDIAAAIAAQRHSGRVCVTASIDELHFLRSIRLGYIVNIEAMLTCVHTTSCEVLVNVSAENPILREAFETTRAYLTFVALDGDGRPTPMPPLSSETEIEKQRMLEAHLRKKNRAAFKSQLLQDQKNLQKKKKT